MKHTPGKWELDRDGYLYIEGYGFLKIRSPYKESSFERGNCKNKFESAEVEANMTLIAVAPEMRQQLIENFKIMFKIWDCTCIKGIDYDMLENEISENQKVIEKATGKSIDEVLK